MLAILDRPHRIVRNLLSIVRPNVPPIFHDACEAEVIRLSLQRPWIAHDRLWASDGRIAIWAYLEHLNLSDRELGLYAAGERKVPDIRHQIGEAWHHPQPVKLPKVKRLMPCGECRGDRRSPHDPDQPCYDCGGTGEWWDTRACKIGDSDMWVQRYYAGLLREHGIESVLIPLHDEWPLRFDHGPISGLLMPIDMTKRPRQLRDEDKRANLAD